MVVVPKRSVQPEQPLTCGKRRCPDWIRDHDDANFKLRRYEVREYERGAAERAKGRGRENAALVCCVRETSRACADHCGFKGRVELVGSRVEGDDTHINAYLVFVGTCHNMQLATVFRVRSSADVPSYVLCYL